ncbi:hypothetical protein HMPREF3036_01886 [Sutterella sp. KLE1602]|nr:hypothetical protein HMPREF3036_01886 [Sutterella sp. KLE1602]
MADLLLCISESRDAFDILPAYQYAGGCQNLKRIALQYKSTSSCLPFLFLFLFLNATPSPTP